MGLAANALLTVEEVRAQINVPDSWEAPSIEFLIDAASDAVEFYCARSFVRATYTNRLFDGTGERYLLADQWPVSSVTKIEFLESANPEAWHDVTAETTPVVDPKSLRLIVLRDRKFPEGLLNVRMTFVAGYLFASLPPSLKQSALDLVAIGFRLVEKHILGVASISQGGQTTTFMRDAIPPETKLRLDPFARVA